MSISQFTILSIPPLRDIRQAIATPTRCDNRQNRIAEAKEAAYGGRPARLQGGPPLHTRFRKGQSGNPGGRSKKKLHALLADALSEEVFVTIDGERRKITKREAVVHQLVNKSATADLRATKMLFDMIKEVEQKASVTSPVPEPRRLDVADKEVVQNFVDRIRQQMLAEMAAERIEAAGAAER
jgi:hypothetical protein